MHHNNMVHVVMKAPNLQKKRKKGRKEEKLGGKIGEDREKRTEGTIGRIKRK